MTWHEAICLPSLTLAYIGDSVYEIAVRRYLLRCGLLKPDDLHRGTVQFVKATFQSRFYYAVLPLLNESETAVLKRGRNSKSGHQPKNTEVGDYRRATAVETLIGALYLSDAKERLEVILSLLYKFIDEEGLAKNES